MQVHSGSVCKMGTQTQRLGLLDSNSKKGKGENSPKSGKNRIYYLYWKDY